jgi:hypothetical protein
MHKHQLRSVFLLAVLSFTSASVRADAQGDPGGDIPEHHVADANAAPVTGRNLLASERFWPYQVALIRPWQPPGRAEPLVPGIAGVLIRVENTGSARIDFGRDGLYEVPVAATDLVENANRIRRGELDKLASNFVLDIGPRLVDSASDSLRPFGLRPTGERNGFLCVFADPSAQGFADLAAALAPLRDRDRVLTILFAQGRHPDAQLREQLRSLGWPIPFMLDHVAEAYTVSLLPGGTALPALMLVTREGRMLFLQSFGPGVMPKLTDALDQTFGSSAPTAGSR